MTRPQSAEPSLTFPELRSEFRRRHIGPREEQIREMLGAIGLPDLEALVARALPPSIMTRSRLELPPALTESEALQELRTIAGQNQVFRSYIGMGYANCIVPPVIQRNLFENPGWYTPYTPYQAEISQGRLEALLNFQTMVADLTGQEIANASLLDEGTAAAEAMAMCLNLYSGALQEAGFFIANSCHPQTIAVVETRARPLGIKIVRGAPGSFDFSLTPIFAALLQYPATDGSIEDYSGFVGEAHRHGALVIVAADLLSLTLLTPPGEWDADVVVGNAQRFGVPLGYGGPHPAFFATRDKYKRQMPGRLVGVSKDSRGRPALRLALQTREQHIRREKATSNICTAQALLASMAAMYAVYHGPEGLRAIALRVRRLTALLAAGLRQLGHQLSGAPVFDTVAVPLQDKVRDEILSLALKHQINLRRLDQGIAITIDETTQPRDLDLLWQIFNADRLAGFSSRDLSAPPEDAWPARFQRGSSFLTQPVFNQHHSETEMLRYLRRLEGRDFTLATSMIPLGSCTMKLNATVEMLPVSWPEFNNIHPFAPLDQTAGYQALFRQLEAWLGTITGFPAVSLQPNAGSQGEYAGLLVIRKYQEDRGQGHRKVCLIPRSAHGTNPASAVMAGLNVVAVECDSRGNVDLGDLRVKAETHREDLAALMITYPSTHGVFEEKIEEICRVVHEHGGQVYMDGANMNAQVGLCRPAEIGVDVCHLNLHKTFCIPHGGGGPGMGPIAVAGHLAPFLPSHPFLAGDPRSIGAICAAPWGSPSILIIPWVYIALMGADGLRAASQVAILNANYIAKRLHPFFPVLYRGAGGFVAHECILDFRPFKQVTVEDAAKRLMDYGFHAPTISFPVPGTMMIEPTESESKPELDRFCEAMISLRAEIDAVETGKVDATNNLLKNAPHTADMIAADSWDRSYSRRQAAYPAAWLTEHKFWPVVGRIDNVFGDRNVICSCEGMDAYAPPAAPKAAANQALPILV